MNIVADIIASAAGIVAIVVAVLLSRHMSHAPGSAHPWISRAIIVIMYAGGSVLAAAGLGQLAAQLLALVDGFIGAWAGLVNLILICAALFLVAELIVEFIWAPTPDAAYTAVAVPLVLALVSGGALHAFYLATTAPGQQIASAIYTWIAG